MQNHNLALTFILVDIDLFKYPMKSSQRLYNLLKTKICMWMSSLKYNQISLHAQKHTYHCLFVFIIIGIVVSYPSLVLSIFLSSYKTIQNMPTPIYFLTFLYCISSVLLLIFVDYIDCSLDNHHCNINNLNYCSNCPFCCFLALSFSRGSVRSFLSRLPRSRSILDI